MRTQAWFGAVTIAALFTGTPLAGAYSADMAVKAPPTAPAPAPAWTWTGFYVGANGGYGGDGDPTVSYAPNDPVANATTCGSGGCIPTDNFAAHGGLGGIQAGYNWQPNQRWVVGVESDFDWSSVTGTGTTSNFTFNTVVPTTPANAQATEAVKWFGTLRARLGWLATDNLLLYGSGGLAYGRVDTSTNIITQPGGAAVGGPFGFVCNGGTCFAGDASRTLAGYAAGAGTAYAISAKFSLFAEYLYVNLGHPGSVNTVAVLALILPSSFTASFSNVTINIVRAGLNYKF